jgi:transposase InsO family protein
MILFLILYRVNLHHLPMIRIMTSGMPPWASIQSKRELETLQRWILNSGLSVYVSCNPCALSKSKHKVPNPVESKSTEVFELIYTDVCGPFPNELYGGSKYFFTIIDDFSRFSRVFFLKRKSDTSIILRAFFNHVERQFSKKIKRIRSDNSGEYISNEFKDLFLTSGVIHELTPPYSPESNGIGKRFNQTINTIARSMTIAAPDLPCLWAEAVNMATYLKNRLPHKHLPSSTTPFERFHRKRPTISHLKPFGSKCYVYISERKSIPQEVNIFHVLTRL